MAKDSKPLAHRTNKEHQKAKKIPREGPAFEVYFAPKPPPADEPVLYFHHIRKTSGTSLRQVIHSNYAGSRGARHVVYSAPDSYDPAVLQDWTRGFLNELSSTERDSIVCIAAHAANHVMHQLDRPARAITFLRDPVDRVLSSYYFPSKPRPFSLEELYARGEDILSDPKWRVWLQFFNGQSRSLLEPLFGDRLPELDRAREAPADADLYRTELMTLLDERYIVGTQDRFEESVAFFAKEFGWDEVFAPRAKVNTRRDRDWKDDEPTELILGFNWLDREIYERYAARPIGE